MPPSPKKKLSAQAANKAFLAKLASITVGTGSKAPNCPDCGGKLKLVGVGIALRRKPQPPKANDEQSFAC